MKKKKNARQDFYFCHKIFEDISLVGGENVSGVSDDLIKFSAQILNRTLIIVSTV